jgi:hypothetical protein
MFLLYHSDRCNTSETVFHWCYVNDLHTTHAVVCWVTTRRDLLGGVVMELRPFLVSVQCLWWQVVALPILVLFIFDLLCKRLSSPLYWFVQLALFIKRGKSLFRGCDVIHCSRYGPRGGPCTVQNEWIR